MKILKIDHLGVAVPSLAEAVKVYEALGFEVADTHDVPSEKVRTAFLPVDDSHIELLEPTDPSSPVAKFLETRKGLHHVCVQVDDIEAALAELKARGVQVLDEAPRVGAGGCKVAFVHPRSAAGVLLELKQPNPDGTSDRDQAVARLRAGINAMGFRSAGPLPARDELHER